MMGMTRFDIMYRLARIGILDMDQKSIRRLLKSSLADSEYREIKQQHTLPDFEGSTLFKDLLQAVRDSTPCPAIMDKATRSIKYPEDFHPAGELEFCSARSILQHLLA